MKNGVNSLTPSSRKEGPEAKNRISAIVLEGSSS